MSVDNAGIFALGVVAGFFAATLFHFPLLGRYHELVEKMIADMKQRNDELEARLK